MQGVSPGDTLTLLSRYNKTEINWFVEKLAMQNKQQKLFDKLDKANTRVIIKGIGQKGGNALYRKWRRKTIDEMSRNDFKKDTVFEKLKKASPRTLFDKLKGL